MSATSSCARRVLAPCHSPTHPPTQAAAPRPGGPVRRVQGAPPAGVPHHPQGEPRNSFPLLDAGMSLTACPVLQVQTKGVREKKGKTPQQAYKDALTALEHEFQDMYQQFEVRYWTLLVL